MKILPPAKNTALYPLGQNTVDGPAIQAWSQGVAQEDALNKNTVLATQFLNVTFHDWLGNYEGGHIDAGNPNAAPPAPPNGFQVQVGDDNYTCDLVQTGPPVCALPSYDKIPAPETLAQAANMLLLLGGNGPQASTAESPFNSKVPLLSTAIAAPDGSRWIRVS